MASINANGSRGHHKFTLNIWEISTDTPSNSSLLGWSLVLSPVQTGWDWNISGISWSVSLNGVNANGNIRQYDGVSTVTLGSGTLNVVHDDNGDKQVGFSFAINDSANKTYTPGSCSASGSMALTHINRYPILTSGSNFTDETNPMLQFTNSGLYPVRVKLEAGGNTQLIIRDIDQNATSYTFNLTETERNTLRAIATNTNSLQVTETVCAMSGNTELNASYKNYTMTIVNGNPTFTDFDYEDTNSTVTNITGDNQVLVKGASNLQVTVQLADKMTAIKQATEKNYVATIGNINQSQNYSDENDVVFDLGTINDVGVQRLNVRAYDSRNNSTLVYKDVTVYDYEKPTVNFTAERLNNFEAQTTLKASGIFSSLVINNVEKNTIQTVQYRYKEQGSSTWSNWANMTFTITNNEYECTDVIVALDNTKEFDLEVKTTDNLSDNTATASIDVGKSIFFVSSNLKECYINDNRVLHEGDFTVLYESVSGATGNLILSDNVGNYKYIEISAINPDDSLYSTQKFYNNNSSNFTVQYNTTYNVNGGVYPSGARYTFNGTSMTVGDYYRVLVAEGAAISYSSSTNDNKIIKIVGYK